jgi:hypothetical protein
MAETMLAMAGVNKASGGWLFMGAGVIDSTQKQNNCPTIILLSQVVNRLAIDTCVVSCDLYFKQVFTSCRLFIT